MSLLSVLNLVGYSMGAALHLWMAALVSRRRHPRTKVERVLIFLAVSVGLWHTANLILTLHSMLGLDRSHWTQLLRVADTVAVISVTFCYSFLLHIHLHLWADARGRSLTFTERIRVYLSYLPTLFLFNAVPRLWLGEYAPMLEKLSNLVLPFALWSAYVLTLIAVTDLLIARLSSSNEEKRIMRTLAISFLVVAALIVSVHALKITAGTPLHVYLFSLANLSSLLPSALLAYYIYRYHYLELAIKESLVIATFAVVVLVVYLFGIRSVGGWLTTRWELNSGSVEALMIVGLALIAAPLRRWLDKRFHHLFTREAALYRDVLASIGIRAGEYQTIAEMISFIEERTAHALGLSRVRIEVFRHPAARAHNKEEQHSATWMTEILELSRHNNWSMVEDNSLLEEQGYRIAYPLRRENHALGLMLASADEGVLSFESRSVLEILAGQIAVVIEEKRLIEENVQLERKLAHGERLSALGEMAATIAHEVKNPLSSIKSIAQVMGEDAQLRREYGRDIDLIVGETDRLNRSVTQLLSFARPAPATERATLDQLISTTVDLLRAEAVAARVSIQVRQATPVVELDSRSLAAVKDTLTNLLINALHATPQGGEVRVETLIKDNNIKISITDDGPGVPPEISTRIWDPFFTTKQRGTGLGLAIAARRMQEIGGSVQLSPPNQTNRGAQFVLTFPRPIDHIQNPGTSDATIKAKAN